MLKKYWIKVYTSSVFFLILSQVRLTSYDSLMWTLLLQVILKESASPQDMLQSLYQINFLYWLETNAGIKSKTAFDDCKLGGKLQISLDYTQREFEHVKHDSEIAGWVIDGLIARPMPHRIRVNNVLVADST